MSRRQSCTGPNAGRLVIDRGGGLTRHVYDEGTPTRVHIVAAQLCMLYATQRRADTYQVMLPSHAKHSINVS
jgi:hypothetical protein